MTTAHPSESLMLSEIVLRLHRGFMPDYNRKATAYWWAMVCLGLAVLVHALQHLALAQLRRHGLNHDALLLIGAIGFALGYFILNTVLVTMVPRLKRNETLHWRSFFDSFGWLGVAYAGNASVATFLYLSFRQ